MKLTEHERCCQTLDFLSYLGYEPGDTVWARLLPGKKFPQEEFKKRGLFPRHVKLELREDGFSATPMKRDKATDRIVEAFTRQDGFEWLRAQNRKGYGVYLVVSEGGYKDEHITRCPALFYEFDGLSKEEQWERAKQLPLEQVFVETRNSLHCYIRLERNSQQVEGFKQLQERLIQAQDSDASVREPSQLMRLPGFDHQQWGAEPFPIVVHWDRFTGAAYTRGEIDGILPPWDAERWGTGERKPFVPSANPKDDLELARECLEYIEPDLPYEEWLRVGMALQSLGDEALPLWDEWSAKGSKYVPGECELKWRSFRGSGVTLGTLVKLAKDRGWQGTRKKPKATKAKRDRTISESRYICDFGIPRVLLSYIQETIKSAERIYNAPEPEQRKREVNADYGSFADVDEFYEISERKQVWRKKLAEKVWNPVLNRWERKYDCILDADPPGGGKSHTAGECEVHDFPEVLDLSEEGKGKPRIFYICNSAENVTTEPVERNYVCLPARSDGKKIDESRRTPSGRPFYVTTDNPEEKQVRNNCSRAGLHHAAQKLNLGVASSHSHGSTDSNTVCANCGELQRCKSMPWTNDGAGFKSEMKERLGYSKIALSSQNSPDVDRSNSIAIVDEPTAHLEVVKTYEVKSSELNMNWSVAFNALQDWQEELGRDASFRLLKFRSALETLQTQPSKFGHELGTLIDAIPDDARLDAINPEDNRILERIESAIERIGLEQLERNALLGEEEAIRATMGCYLPLLLRITAKHSYTRGSVRVFQDRITLTCRNERLLQDLKESAGLILLNAYSSKAEIAMLLDIPESKICKIASKPKPVKNLRIKQITGLGDAGKNRSQECDRRIEALRAAAIANYGRDNVGFIDHKAKAKPGELAHFSGSRGSNEYQHKKAVMDFGTPYESLSAMQDLYQALTGRIVRCGQHKGDPQTDPEFQKFIDNRTQATICQEIGRLRATRREDDCDFLFVSDYPLDFLTKNFGWPVEVIPAAQYCPEAADRTHTARVELLQAAKQILESGRKFTQKAIAEAWGRSAARMSQVLREWFGEGAKPKQLLRFLKLMSPFAERLSRGEALKQEQIRASLPEDLVEIAIAWIPDFIENPEYSDAEAVESCFELIQVAITTHGMSAAVRLCKIIPWRTRALLLLRVTRLVASKCDEELRGFLEFLVESFSRRSPTGVASG